MAQAIARLLGIPQKMNGAQFWEQLLLPNQLLERDLAEPEATDEEPVIWQPVAVQHGKSALVYCAVSPRYRSHLLPLAVGLWFS